MSGCTSNDGMPAALAIASDSSSDEEQIEPVSRHQTDTSVEQEHQPSTCYKQKHWHLSFSFFFLPLTLITE